ncbi:hypothetical protein Moror_5762 [Moniliophthora roreri MCA 2997]|uniref:Uncharacterized protein n=1 Tax=Moniliophthora roreri (strain MCA 2997) TaxID=1381753 RepID=V2X3B8_MONRO|nr:hypothetical protein Moror_5762 [Moniliophthora roreri MCA 2997]
MSFSFFPSARNLTVEGGNFVNIDGITPGVVISGTTFILSKSNTSTFPTGTYTGAQIQTIEPRSIQDLFPRSRKMRRGRMGGIRKREWQ